MSAATEQALARRVAELETRLGILQAQFEALDKAAVVMANASDTDIAYQWGQLMASRRETANATRGPHSGQPRPPHLHVVR